MNLIRKPPTQNVVIFHCISSYPEHINTKRCALLTKQSYMLMVITSIRVYFEVMSLGSQISFFTNKYFFMFTVVVNYNNDINSFIKLCYIIIYTFKWCLWLINGRKRIIYLFLDIYRCLFFIVACFRFHRFFCVHNLISWADTCNRSVHRTNNANRYPNYT